MKKIAFTVYTTFLNITFIACIVSKHTRLHRITLHIGAKVDAY